MTTDPTAHPDDELASAHLDGATTPEEAARVASDPALLARVEVLRSVRAAVALPDRPVDPDRREAAIAAALGALHDDDAVLSLSMARARRRRMLATRAAGVAVAAAVALSLAVPRLTADDDRNADVVASEDADREAADDVFSSGPSAGGSTGDVGAGEPRAQMELSVPILTVDQASDLGAAPDLDALAAAAAASLSEGAPLLPLAPAPADRTASDACLVALQSEQLPVLLVAVAELAGRPVVLVVVAQDDGGRRLEVAAVAGCERLGPVLLPG